MREQATGSVGNMLENVQSQQMNRNVAIEQYEMLAAENSKLKMSLGDMIDKYKMLY